MKIKKMMLFTALCLAPNLWASVEDESQIKVSAEQTKKLNSKEEELFKESLNERANAKHYRDLSQSWRDTRIDNYKKRSNNLDNDIKRYMMDVDPNNDKLTAKLSSLKTEQLKNLQQRLESRIEKEKGFFASKGLREDLQSLKEKVKKQIEEKNRNPSTLKEYVNTPGEKVNFTPITTDPFQEAAEKIRNNEQLEQKSKEDSKPKSNTKSSQEISKTIPALTRSTSKPIAPKSLAEAQEQLKYVEKNINYAQREYNAAAAKYKSLELEISRLRPSDKNNESQESFFNMYEEEENNESEELSQEDKNKLQNLEDEQFMQKDNMDHFSKLLNEEQKYKKELKEKEITFLQSELLKMNNNEEQQKEVADRIATLHKEINEINRKLN